MAAKVMSPEAMPVMENFCLGSSIPASMIFFLSLASRATRRPCICPPKQASEAAARTPCGAPPIPQYISIPLFGQAVATAPETSPSTINIMRAPASRVLAIISPWRGRSRMQTTRSLTGTSLASPSAFRLSAGSLSRSTRPVGSPPPTAIFSMYRSGTFRNPPLSVMAMTERPLGSPLATMVGPSTGIRATSTAGP